MDREDLESDEERAAYDLCVGIGCNPWECVRVGDVRFSGYEGDYFMNWARDRVFEYKLISQSLTKSAMLSQSKGAIHAP